MKVAVFPGSFDPITIGHVDLVLRAMPLFDEIYIAIGENTKKQYVYTLNQRLDWLRRVFSEYPNIKVDYYNGLTVEFCRKVNAGYLLRGLRNASDFDYEKTISQLNHIIGDKIETVFLISRPEYSHISSTIVREIIKAGGDATPFLPPDVRV